MDRHKEEAFKIRFNARDKENIALLAAEHASMSMPELVRYALEESTKSIRARHERIASINRVIKRS